MKKLMFGLLVTVIVLSGCKKEMSFIPSNPLIIPGFELLPKYLSQPIATSECIDSYVSLVSSLGENNAVKAVVLENGQVITIGQSIVSMTYVAKPVKESNSLFRSLFFVSYEDGGIVISSSQNVWTLGCRMADRAAPPFTNILYRNKAYLINTCFLWSVPLLAHTGYRIVWLIL